MWNFMFFFGPCVRCGLLSHLFDTVFALITVVRKTAACSDEQTVIYVTGYLLQAALVPPMMLGAHSVFPTQ